MTARSSLAHAAVVSDQMDDIIQALIVLALPGVVITMGVVAPGAAGVTVPLPLNPANLTTLLNARLVNLQTQLTALGVT